jgi:cytochrome c oxidase subunit 2
MRCSKLLHNSTRVCTNRNAGRWVVLACALVVGGCNGAQSALDPAGREAERIADLFWWMVAGAVIVWLSVVGLTVYSVRARPESQNQRRAGFLIIGGGAVVPTVVLGVLLAYGLSMLPALVAPAPEGSLKVSVTGEQWWWRVRYQPPGSEAIVMANEIRLPVGEPVEFWLESADVIHSFWIPPLGGKVDMIPGRLTRLALVPTKTGVFRGVCAEYCGTSHALMSFYVEVMEKEEFARWLAHQAAPAGRASDQLATRGQELFLAQGCSACHAVRGTPANGVIGPDLTHVGSRLSLGAGILPNEPDTFQRWIAHAENAKPGVQMPAFGMLSQDELRALAAYVEGLK